MTLDRKFIGKGLSASVYLQIEDSRKVAVKVFSGSGAADVVNTVMLGAPNPRRWNLDALISAYHTRKILRQLLEYETSGRVSVADAYDVG